VSLPQIGAPRGSTGAAKPGVQGQLQGRCYRCGRPTRSPDVGLCDTCNPSGIAGPTATQVHGLILASVAGALIAMALAAKLLASSTGPFPAAVIGQAVDPDGTVQIVMRLTNAGATAARPTCTLTRGPDDVGVEFLAERVDAGASVVITKRVPALPSGSADGLAQVTCR
jgi:hypothetical protein